MKLVSYKLERDDEHVGALVGDEVVDLAPMGSMLELLDGGPPVMDSTRALLDARARGAIAPEAQPLVYALEEVQLLAPVPRPRSLRDFYAFEQHVRTARANRGADMIPDWYDVAVFYFSNHQAVSAPYAPVLRPHSSRALDFELEIGCVIGLSGVDIPVERAGEYIAGYCVMNDWSARDLQMKEMKMNLGPAKGKDFATTLGPWLVTPDEIEDRRIVRPEGSAYDLAMTARINGQEVSRGNWKDIYFTFEQMIARASADVRLYPGDVLGSGTVGTGCLLELTKGQGPWLQPGDVVELEIERLGVIRNRVALERDDYVQGR